MLVYDKYPHNIEQKIRRNSTYVMNDLVVYLVAWAWLFLAELLKCFNKTSSDRYSLSESWIRCGVATLTPGSKARTEDCQSSTSLYRCAVRTSNTHKWPTSLLHSFKCQHHRKWSMWSRRFKITRIFGACYPNYAYI